MKDKIQQILGAGLVGIVMILAKNSDVFVRQAGKVVPEVISAAERVGPKAGSILARQYIKEDHYQGGANIDNWSNKEYKDYFLLNLGQVSQLIDTVKSIDSTYGERVKRNYNWLRNYYFGQNDKSALNEVLTICEDSSKPVLQEGAKYFLRLLSVDYYLNDIDFKRSLMNDQIVKMLIKKTIFGKIKY